MKISNWLLNYDEKFWSIVKDDHKREGYLNQLHRFRVASFSLLCFCGIMTFLGIIFDKGWFIGIMLILCIAQGVNYLDTDSKIRTIRLYELFSTENKKV